MGRILLLIILVGGTFFVLRPLSGSFGSAPAVRLPAVVQRGGAMTVLVLGLDRRGAEVTRSDTMLLVRVGPPGRTSAVLSIPRDLWVPIPGHGEDRINTAYVWGELKNHDGASLARRTVEENLEVTIDRVAVVDFDCFQQAIDVAGGVAIDVPGRLVDPAHPMPDGRIGQVVFEAGIQGMSGEQALRYARMRAPDSDFGRIRRQQQVVSALGERIKDPGIAVKVGQAFLRRCPGSGLDLTAADLASIGAMASVGGEPRMRLIDESMVTPTTLPSGAQVLLPHWDQIRALANELFGRAAI